MKIPIQNVYYLLCYAWNHVQAKDLIRLSEVPADRPEDLFAKVLAEGVGRVQRRGLDRGYVERGEEILGIRGKLDLGRTIKRTLTLRGRIHCVFEELQLDILPNRILKATLRDLLALELDSKTRSEVRRVYEKMAAVSDIRLSRRHFRTLQIQPSNRTYEFLLRLCLLVHDNLMPERGTGRVKFNDFRRDDATMWRLFEDFVHNFYRRELRHRFRVSRPRIRWHGADEWDENSRYLPGMQTDVFLDSPDRRIVLDCKFYSEPLSLDRFGGITVRSENLYQLFSYMVNKSAAVEEGPVLEGVLLYPAVRERLDLRYVLSDHPVRVLTIDLGQDWRGIYQDMLAIMS